MKNHYLFIYGGREETRTPMPKALDPKSSASTNFATRPYFIYQPFLALLFSCQFLLDDASTAPLEKDI